MTEKLGDSMGMTEPLDARASQRLLRYIAGGEYV